MPEFTVKEVRLPELHLPEVKRDEIVRALSGVHVPEVDLARVEPRRRLRDVDVRGISSRLRSLTDVDAGKVMATAITAARIARPARSRSRWSGFRPFRRSRWAAVSRSRDDLVAIVRPAPRRSRRRIAAVVIALSAAAAWMLFRNPAVRSRIDRATESVRRRIGELRSGSSVDVALETGEPVSVMAVETESITSLEPATTATETDVTEGATNPA